ncbi:MAG: zf-HC2 domain-containing protein [Bacteroidota bacterium]
MSKLKCKDCRGLLPDYVDGKLDAEQSAALRKHLSVSATCASEEQHLRALFTGALTRDIPKSSILDPGSFLVGINAEIDRRRRGQFSSVRNFTRPAFLVPVLATAVLLLIASVFYFPFAGRSSSSEMMFSGLISEADVNGLAEIETLTPLLNDVLLSELQSSGEIGAYEINDLADATVLNTEIDETLLDDVSYSSVVSASLEYISPDDVLEQLSQSDADDIVTILQNQSIMLL